MLYIDIENTKIPALGYGTWKLQGDECIKGVSKALEVGYRHIDTAQIYGNETEVGTALSTSPVDREDIFLTTKVWITELSNGKLQNSVEESLKKLKTDYVNMLLIHWPVEDDAPFSEQLEALQEVKESGKAKMIGISNFTLAQMKHVTEELGIKVYNNQVEYHPFLSQNILLDYIRKHDMFLTAYCPVARGEVANNSFLQDLGEKYGKTPGQITLRWLVQQEKVAAIPKAASEKHIIENFNIFDFELSDDDIRKSPNLAKPDGRMIDPDFAPAWDKAA